LNQARKYLIEKRDRTFKNSATSQMQANTVSPTSNTVHHAPERRPLIEGVPKRNSRVESFFEAAAGNYNIDEDSLDGNSRPNTAKTTRSRPTSRKATNEFSGRTRQ